MNLHVLRTEQLAANVCVFVEHSTGEELVSRPDASVLKVIPVPLNGVKYLAVQTARFQELLMELLSTVQDC